MPAPGNTRGPVIFPVPVVVDRREQLPFSFAGLSTDAREGSRPLTVTTTPGTLPAGDYSLEGYVGRLAVERKSLSDLFQSLGRERAREERKLARMDSGEHEYAAYVVEADWDAVLLAPPEFTRVRPKTIFRTVIAWQVRYPRVQWWFCPGRRFAEVVTFRLLERFYKVTNKVRPGRGRLLCPGHTNPSGISIP